MQLYKIEVEIREPAWECDEYGTPEYDAGSIFVPVILAIKTAGDYSIGDAKRVAEERYPDGVRGRTVLTFLGNANVLGNLTALQWERADQIANKGMPQLTLISVISVEKIGGRGTPIVVHS